MGFIKAFTGALQGSFADEWKEFIVPRNDISSTTALFSGVKNQQMLELERTQRVQKMLLQTVVKLLFQKELH